jgi:Di-haem oxidoreductase, putative peroxidase
MAAHTVHSCARIDGMERLIATNAALRCAVLVLILLASAAIPVHADGQNGQNGQLGQNGQNAANAVGMSGFGQPLSAITQGPPNGADLQLFVAGQQVFNTPINLPQLGPLFNNRSCAACHFVPAMGGSGGFISEIRVRDNPSSDPVHIFATDNCLRGGPQQQGAMTIFGGGLMSMPLGCQITDPGCQLSPCQQQELVNTTFSPSLPICDPGSSSFAHGDNCSAERQSPAVFGFGLIEAVADQTLIDIANSQPASIRGTVKMLTEFGSSRVARFGWKDDAATLRAFATMATANELGLTTPDHPSEVSTCDQGQTQFGILLDADDDPEDQPDSTGRANIDRMVDFMRALSPPPSLGGNSSGGRGQKIFEQIGCAGCHVETLQTASNPASFIPPTTGGVPITPSLNTILANQNFHPFSDFLLHDMGSLGDGITSGAAGPTMMRTAPLWGLRSKARFLHDGRASDLTTAIILHGGQGNAAAQAFSALTPSQQQDLLRYLGSI